MNTKQHHVIISPGLDGRIWGLQMITKNWPKKYQLYPDIVQTIWKDERDLKPKLQKIIDLIDLHHKQDHIVSLVGTSASGSLILNAYLERRDKVHKVINIGGFLRPGSENGIRNFKTRSTASISFYQSVMQFTEREPQLSRSNRKKILTVHPRFGDELVPANCVTISGATNETIFSIEHIASIAASLFFYKPVIQFLKS